MEDNYNKITNNIWLGNKYAASDNEFIQKNNIKRIINVTSNIENNKYKNIKYFRVPLDTVKIINKKNKFNPIIIDNINFDIYCKICNIFIEEGINNGENILIHCKKGHTRSAIILLNYLMYKYKNIPEKEIIKYIQNNRNNTLKNYTYIVYLNEISNKILDKISLPSIQ